MPTSARLPIQFQLSRDFALEVIQRDNVTYVQVLSQNGPVWPEQGPALTMSFTHDVKSNTVQVAIVDTIKALRALQPGQCRPDSVMPEGEDIVVTDVDHEGYTVPDVTFPPISAP